MKIDKKQIYSLSNYILEQFQDMDYDRESNNLILKNKLNSVLNAVESYCVLTEKCNDFSCIDEAKLFEKRLKAYISEYNYQKKLHEGFQNPFDTDSDAANRYIEDNYISYESPRKDISVKKVQLWNRNTPNKVIYKDGKMYAGQFFGKGDIIEECPVRLIQTQDLYSKNVRDFAFTLDRSKGLYAIPFGYASYYRNSKDSGIDSNADYSFSLDEDFIKIYATCNISNGDEIILYSDEEDFGNEIEPGQFEYKTNSTEPYCRVTGCKIV